MTVVKTRTVNANFEKYVYQRTGHGQEFKLIDSPPISNLFPYIRIEENQRKGKVKTHLIIRGNTPFGKIKSYLD